MRNPGEVSALAATYFLAVGRRCL